jgi:hypothetical protein
MNRARLRREWYLWLIPVLTVFLYVQLAGYPIFIALFTEFCIFAIAAALNIIPSRCMYVAGGVMLILCPLWLIADIGAWLGRDFYVLRTAFAWHMADSQAMARVCGDAAFICFSSGVAGETVRLLREQQA